MHGQPDTQCLWHFSNSDSGVNTLEIKLEIVPERAVVLFRAGTLSLRSTLGTFFVPAPDHAKHFRWIFSI